MSRVEIIHQVLVEELGYAESPTMAAEMWPIAERVATAIRVAERYRNAQVKRLVLSETDQERVQRLLDGEGEDT